MKVKLTLAMMIFSVSCKVTGTIEPRQSLERQDTLQVNNDPFPGQTFPLPSSEPPTQEVVIDSSELCEQTEPSIVCMMEARIFELTNQLRSERGLKPFSYKERLAYVARSWSQEQAFAGITGQGNISHDGFPQARRMSYEKKYGPSSVLRIQGENVAYTYVAKNDLMKTAESLFQMWRTSFGHYRNMVGNFQSIGIGVYIKNNRYVYATQIFGRDQ